MGCPVCCLQVLRTLLHQAWRSNPQHYLSNKLLVTLLFSTAQLAAAPPVGASPTTMTTAAAATAPQEASAAAAASGACTAATTGQSEAATVVSDGCRQDAAAVAAVPDLAALSAVIDQLILSTMPEHEQQQPGDSLTVEDLIRVLWSCCVLGSLHIAQFGWLLVAVAGGSWQRLGQEQLLVIKQGEVRSVWVYLQITLLNPKLPVVLRAACFCHHCEHTGRRVTTGC